MSDWTHEVHASWPSKNITERLVLRVRFVGGPFDPFVLRAQTLALGIPAHATVEIFAREPWTRRLWRWLVGGDRVPRAQTWRRR